MKRALPLILALVLVLGLCVPAAAADNDLETAMDRVLQGIREWQTEVDLSDLNIYTEETMSALNRLYKHPELFYYDYYTVWSSSSTGKVSKVELHYHSGYDQRHVAAFDQAAEEALRCVLPGMDDLQKLLVLHDYLVMETRYDEVYYSSGTVPESSYTAYGALVLGEAVCQGYTLAYQYLLEQCGIPSVYVSSDAMDHGWCLVQLEGEWYHVDVTWDDPTPDNLGHVLHKYFLLSDDAISDEEHRHTAWEAEHACTDTRYEGDVFWASEEYPIADTSIIFTDADTLWFLKESGDYIDQSISLIRRDWETGVETVAATVYDYWPVWQESSHWLNAYSSLCLWDQRLFFQDSCSIYSYDPATGVLETEFTYDAHDGYLYGLYAWKDILLVVVKQGPREEETVYKYTPERRYAPAPEPVTSPFTDVDAAAYYYDAVLWAYENNVTKGTSETEFSPGATCKRGQVVTFLWRAMGCPEPVAVENPFGDVAEDAYYRNAVLWAVENGITNGTGVDPDTGKPLFSPENNCSYAHILTFLWRTVTGNCSSAYGEWYSEPMDWANSLTLLQSTALGRYESSVSDDCPRCDVVTFLCRAVGAAA